MDSTERKAQSKTWDLTLVSVTQIESEKDSSYLHPGGAQWENS